MTEVVSIPFEKPFLETLAQELHHQTASNPMDLSDYLLFLPTQRACRRLREILVQRSPHRLTPLPKMIALGSLRPDVFPYPLTTEEDAIDDLDRQAILAKLIEKFPRQNAATIPFSQAFLLAKQLGNLLDQTILEDLNSANLEKIVPDAMASHWQLTHDFLKIVFDAWPEILKEKNQVDPGRQQKNFVENLINYWTEYPPDKPIWIAGSTGSLAITRKIMKGILALPKGRIFLPGFDPKGASQQSIPVHVRQEIRHCHPDLVSGSHKIPKQVRDDDDYRTHKLKHDGYIQDHPTHPQYTMYMCCQDLGIPSEQVHILGEPNSSSLASIFNPLTLHPIESTESQDFDHLSVLECSSPESEAGVISILLREITEDPSKTGLLITPDRTLARRVSTLLRRWNIEVDDSSGKPLSECPVGILARGLIEWMQEPSSSPVKIMGLLKHPLTHLGYEKKTLHNLARLYERHLRDDKEALSDKQEFKTFINLIEQDLDQKKDESFSISAFRALLIRFTGSEILLTQNEDGREVLKILNILEEKASLFENLSLDDFAVIFSHLLSQTAIRLKSGGHPQITILGPLEARLLKADAVILAGLNENTWPMVPDPDPWLSRQMRIEFGLQPLEQRIGLAAHDVLQALHNDRVYLTRSLKMDGSPTIPCRWLTRLFATTLKTDLHNRWKTLSHTYETWWHDLDRPIRTEPISAPRPTPPRNLRPLAYSATQIETLIKDPYKFYVTKILNLRELNPLEREYGAREKGILFHDILETLFKKNLFNDTAVIARSKTTKQSYTDKDQIAAPPLEVRNDDSIMKNDVMTKIITEKIRETGAPAIQQYFLHQQIHEFLTWFIPFEQQRLSSTTKTIVETFGNMELKLPSQDIVRISAKFDRIDYDTSAHARIIDYKTGMLPSVKSVRDGFFPQLPIEGLILKHGDIGEIFNSHIIDLEYIRIQSCAEKAIQSIDKETDQLMKDVLDGLYKLLDDFLKQETPYLSQPHPDFNTYTSPIDHLARIQEWRAA